MDIDFSHFPYTNMGKDSPPGTPGVWYTGATPSPIDKNKAPIVFIHGLNGSSYIWIEESNMYEIAFNEGFQTAFVDLYPTKDMWNNGELLASQLKEIYNHFGEKVILIAHSKGGIDAQTALFHNGASSYVQRVITLSSPHHGAELADLAYSSWAGWLAEILGSRNEATFSLQTGNMKLFRSRIDNYPAIKKVPFYTMAGTGWGFFGTSLYWGGLYLSSYGSNDGVVTVKSSRLSYANEIGVSDWNHYEILQGNLTFPFFHDYLFKNITQQLANTLPAKPSTTAASYVRGGYSVEETEEDFYVEDGVDAVTINWISDQMNTDLSVKGPAGEVFTEFKSHVDQTYIFQGSAHHFLKIDHPQAGKWSIHSKNKNSRYLLMIHYQSYLNKELELALDEADNMIISLQKVPPFIGSINSTIRLEHYHSGKQTSHTFPWTQVNAFSKKIANLGEGVYNFTIDIYGKTLGNYPFNRTVISSVYMDSSGKLYK
ncbi:esterase/lipase family protein [Halobacillus massiliensis]|uniref:esterase/lipase family protein n=1 Tax=Halobacillus massiliensis TaxID=1926286 RepID=UPI0009E514A7|nr:alpha/beta fold hydrolase [Halobacillus massiliensis]